MNINIKRLYEEYSDKDGHRVLVDRLWPRGISKEDARIDDWSKDLAPSTELREWYGHRPERFDEFKARYTSELSDNKVAAEFVKKNSNLKKLTLLYAAKDTNNNHALVLKSYLEELINKN